MRSRGERTKRQIEEERETERQGKLIEKDDAGDQTGRYARYAKAAVEITCSKKTLLPRESIPSISN